MSATGTVTQPLRYMARELDATSGLYYVRNRWYDPEQGRFVSEDPIGLAGGMNPYAYAENSPPNSLDPLGLDPCRWYDYSFGSFVSGRVLSAGCKTGDADDLSDRGSGWPRGGAGGPGSSGSGDPTPRERPDWSSCASDVAKAGIGVAGDAALLSPAGMAFKGIKAVRAGRAGLAAVRSRAVVVGRGALLRRSGHQIAGGRTMAGLGAAEMAFAWAGEGTISSGLEQSVITNGGDSDGSFWDWVPFIGTGRNIINAAKSCFAAGRAQFGF